jgi:hypothetical protein
MGVLKKQSESSIQEEKKFVSTKGKLGEFQTETPEIPMPSYINDKELWNQTWCMKTTNTCQNAQLLLYGWGWLKIPTKLGKTPTALHLRCK